MDLLHADHGHHRHLESGTAETGLEDPADLSDRRRIIFTISQSLSFMFAIAAILLNTEQSLFLYGQHIEALHLRRPIRAAHRQRSHQNDQTSTYSV